MDENIVYINNLLYESIVEPDLLQKHTQYIYNGVSIFGLFKTYLFIVCIFENFHF